MANGHTLEHVAFCAAMVKCVFSPNDIVQNYLQYTTAQRTLHSIERRIQQTYTLFPQQYCVGFGRKACMRNGKLTLSCEQKLEDQGPFIYNNYDEWDGKRIGQLFLGANVVHETMVRKHRVKIGLINVIFTYQEKHDAAGILRAFISNWNLWCRTNDPEPLIERYDLDGKLIDHGATTLTTICGKINAHFKCIPILISP